MVALIVAAVGFLPLLALWWADTGSIDSFASALTGAGQLAGLAAGYSVLLLIVLSARIPVLDRIYGSDRLLKWHSSAGRWSVIMILVHALTITFGMAAQADEFSIAGAWGIAWSSTTLILASIAGLLLIAVGVASIQAARRAMSYEVWHAIHLTTYVAIGLGFAHQVLDGSQFVARPVLQISWLAAYALALAALIYYRVIVVVRTTRRHRIRVDAVTVEAPGHVSVYFTGNRLSELRAQGGQFFRWHFAVPGRRWASNPYSLSAAPDGDRLRITVKEDGAHSGQLRTLPRGTKVWIEGPYGRLTANRISCPDAVFIAGGIGIAPLRAILESAPLGPGRSTLIYRVQSWDLVVFRAELEALAASRGVRLAYAVGHRGDIGDAIEPQGLLRLAPAIRQSDVFVCGPEGMTESVIKSVRALGIPRQRIHAESFTG